MQYWTVKEAAARWQLTERRVQELCRVGAVRDAIRWGRGWMIPADTERPADRRRKENRGISSAPRRPLLLAMTSFYSEPGSADRLFGELSDRPASSLLFESQLCYFRGDIRRAQELSHRVLTMSDIGFDGQAGAGLMLALCGIHRGNLALYREGKHYLVSVPYTDGTDLAELSLWRAGLESELLDVDGFPAWLRSGKLSEVPRETHPAARFFYLKYLFVYAHERLKRPDNRVGIVDLMRLIPTVGEPLVAQTAIEGSLLCEIYLRLMCAVGYHRSGMDDLAVEHLDRAIALAMPDRLWQPFVETRRLLDYLLDDHLGRVSSEALREVKRLNKTYLEGWTSLQNLLLSRKVSNHLTIREREVARLAVYGLSNKEIALWLHISVNAVKLALRIAMDKTGAEKRADLGNYV